VVEAAAKYRIYLLFGVVFFLYAVCRVVAFRLNHSKYIMGIFWLKNSPLIYTWYMLQGYIFGCKLQLS